MLACTYCFHLKYNFDLNMLSFRLKVNLLLSYFHIACQSCM